jgi:DNA-binding MurR/RpiR family transcriptional regulator
MQDLIDRMKNTKLVGDQQAIASFLTQDLQKTAFLGSSEIASACGVSVSAVTRLAQKLGYDGFPELKKDLESLYRKRITPLEVFETFVKQSADHSVTSLTLSQELENIRNFQTQIQQDDVDQVIKLILKSDRVYLVGIGVAEILVDHLAILFEVLGKPVTRLKGFGLSKQAEMINFSSHDMVIGFSFQRILREVRDVVLRSKNSGSRTLAITDSETNPLALVCDKTLTAPVVGTTLGMSLVSPLVLVNVLGNALAAADKSKNQKILQKVKKDWESYPIFCD